MRLYLGKCGIHGYELGKIKDDFNEKIGFDGSYVDGFCAKYFESITGLKLKPGEIRKVKITKGKNKFTFELED